MRSVMLEILEAWLSAQFSSTSSAPQVSDPITSTSHTTASIAITFGTSPSPPEGSNFATSQPLNKKQTLVHSETLTKN